VIFISMRRKKLSKIDRFAIAITNRVGTINFFLLIVLWTAMWLGWNTLAPKAWQFDPYPGFVLWLFISNMIQIFLMPLILIGQNIQTKQTEELTKLDYNLDKEIEKDIHDTMIKVAEILSIVKKDKK
jgi:uncharacterized membrane protein